jgi:hypothetical protein
MREFGALLKRYEIVERIKDTRAALAPWTLNCIYRDPKRSAPSLGFWMSTFMPWSSGGKRGKKTPEDLQTMIIALNAALGGEVIEN